MEPKLFSLALVCTVVACGPDAGSDSASSVLGYSYDCYGMSYEFPIGSTIMLHEWFCRVQEPSGGQGTIDCWQSAKDYAVEDPINPHERLTGRCPGSLDLESRSGDICTIRFDCQ